MSERNPSAIPTNNSIDDVITQRLTARIKELNTHDDAANAEAVLQQKLQDALTPGVAIEFTAEEAARAGIFREDALSEKDAIDSQIDRLDTLAQSTTTER